MQSKIKFLVEQLQLTLTNQPRYSLETLLLWSAALFCSFHWRLTRWRKWRACDAGEAKEGWRMSCDVGEATESMENEQSYVTAHSPTVLSLYLHHSSFSNPSVALTTSQLILQPFFCFS